MNEKENPIKAWLARVAVECGAPQWMIMEANRQKNANTRSLLIEYAIMWQRKINLKRRA